MSRTTDLTRDRKVRVTLQAMHLLTLGLALCLLGAWLVKDSVGLLVGLYAPFGVGIGGALGLFINGNVQVHRANAAAPAQSPTPGSTP